MCGDITGGDCTNCAMGHAEPELMRRMSEALGVDRLLGETERAAAAERCEACTDTQPCEDFLAEADLRGVDHAPGFCRNKDLFDERASEAPSTF